MAQIIKLVFSDYRYVLLSVIIFTGMVIPLLIISEYIFLEPYLVAHLPPNSELGFSLIVAVSAMSGLVLSMNVYRIKMVKSNSKKKMGGGVLGTLIGSIAGACSCHPDEPGDRTGQDRRVDRASSPRDRRQTLGL